MAKDKDNIVIKETEESVSITPTGVDTTKKEGFELTATDKQPTSLADMFDRFQKKLYLIDVSGSMNSGMAPEDEVAQFKWTPEALAKFREYIKDQLAATMIAEDPQLTKAEADAEADDAMAVIQLDNDEELKRYVVQDRTYNKANIALDHNYVPTESKISAVRGAMVHFVEQRFQKFPDAQVGLFSFNHETHVMCYPGANKETVLSAVQLLACSGGTDIKGAVERALKEFKRRPSQVGAHHIILVTDGQSYNAMDLPQLIPQMKAMNIVFDFIYVKGQHEDVSSYKELVDAIKKVCTATGGEYNEVSKSSDFKRKFLEVSSRRALPPARD